MLGGGIVKDARGEYPVGFGLAGNRKIGGEDTSGGGSPPAQQITITGGRCE